MKSFQRLMMVGALVCVTAGTAMAVRICLRLAEVPLPLAVDEYGQLGIDFGSDGSGSAKLCVNTSTGDGNAKLRGWIPNDSGAKVNLRNDSQIDGAVEDFADDFGVDLEIHRSHLKVSRRGKMKYSSRFTIEDIDFDLPIDL